MSHPMYPATAQPGPYPPADPQQGYGQPPQQGYYPQQQYVQPQPQYAQPQQGYVQPPQQPAPPLARGTLEDFFSQPAGGSGKSLSAFFTTPGQSIGGYVNRPLTAADVQQQTDVNQRPLFHKDGRPKLVMIVPLDVQSVAFPDGRASWWVKGQAQNELARAMAEAGAPAGAPESGAFISITFTGTRDVPGRNPAKLYAITYTRPDGAAQAAAAQPAQVQVPSQPQPQFTAPQAPSQQLPGSPAPGAPQPGYAPQPAYAAPGPQPGVQAPQQPQFEGQGYGQGFGQPQPQAAPPAQAPYQGQPQPQYGMMAPGQQVQAATDAAMAAAQAQGGYPQGQVPQPAAPAQPPAPQLAPAPGTPPATANLLQQLISQPAPAPQQ